MRRLLPIAVALTICGAAWAGPAPEWVKLAIPGVMPEWTKSANAVVLLDDTLITVRSAGDVTTRHRRVVRIQTNAGRDHAYATVFFDNDTKLRSLRAWSIDAKGATYEVAEREAMETTPYDGEMYSDTRAKVLRIPGGDPGTTVAIEYERRERPYLLQEMWSFQEEIPVLRTRLQTVLPEGWRAETYWDNYAPVDPTGGVWELRDVPAITDEPKMPSAMALAGRMAVSFVGGGAATAKPGWNDVANWFARLASSRAAGTPEVQAKVRELAGPSASESIRAMARFTQRDVRYVAIEIGIGGYQPHPAGDVFRNRYGDCKDKATLLKAMLAEIGVPSYYVLVHTTRGVVDANLPALGSFNHVILAVATPDRVRSSIDHPRLGKLVIFDPTDTTTPFGYLPWYLQASSGLLVTPAGGDLIALPSHPADANQLRRKATLQLDASGTLTGRIEEVRTGSIAAALRGELRARNIGERVRYVESSVGAHLANYAVSDIVIDHLDDADAELVIRYGITAKDYARKVADMILVRPRVIGQKSEAIVAVGDRKHPYVTAGPSLQTDQIEIAVAPAFTMDELPPAVSVSTPLVEYSSRSALEGSTLRYERRYALHAWHIERDSLPGVNAAFAKILADERASAVFKTIDD